MRTCDHCGGAHANVPTERATCPGDELGAYCPHCGDWHGLGTADPDAVERHPATPLDEPVTVLCAGCNGGFYIDVDGR